MPRLRPRKRSSLGDVPTQEEFAQMFPSLAPDDYYAYRDNSLDISTIHRLLRHLRNKVDSLRDLLLKSNPALSATSHQDRLRPPVSAQCDDDEYSDWSDTSDAHRSKIKRRKTDGNATRRPSGRTRGASMSALHELTFLPHPSQLQRSSNRHNSTMCGVPVLELSKKVYALGDAFRNVVMKVQTLNTDEAEEPFNTCGEGPGRNGVMTLVEMCVRIIGNDIEASVEERLDEASSDEDDIEKTGLIDYCYDKIPDHLKRWMVIPHVIQILLINVPRDIVTLWDMCLDATIEYNAKADSITLLKRLFRHALIPSSALSRPLILSGPVDFLARLFKKSIPTSPSKPVPNSWSEAEFVNILIRIISEVPAKQVESVWTSDAVSLLFAELVDGNAQCRMVQALAKIKPTSAAGLTTLRDWSESVLKASLELTAWEKPPQPIASEWCCWLERVGVALNDFLEDSVTEFSLKKSSPHSVPLKDLTLSIILQSLYLALGSTDSTEDGCAVLNELVIYAKVDKLQQRCLQFTSLLSTARESDVGRISMDIDPLLDYAEAVRLGGFFNLEVAYLGAVFSTLLEDDAPSNDMEAIQSALDEAQQRWDDLQYAKDTARLESSPADPLGTWDLRSSSCGSPIQSIPNGGLKSRDSGDYTVPDSTGVSEDEVTFTPRPHSHRKRRRILDSDDEDTIFTPKRLPMVVVCIPTPDLPLKSRSSSSQQTLAASTSKNSPFAGGVDEPISSRLTTERKSSSFDPSDIEIEKLLESNTVSYSPSPLRNVSPVSHNTEYRPTQTTGKSPPYGEFKTSHPMVSLLSTISAIEDGTMDVDLERDPQGSIVNEVLMEPEPRPQNLLNLPPVRSLNPDRRSSAPRISRLLSRRSFGGIK